ncbi:MAG TPA: DUF4262 domain-containing protein [Anaeromyxobacter sp.]
MRGEPAIVCRHVLEGAPILFAARDEPGEASACEWHFRCGVALHRAEDGRVLELDEVVRRDPTAIEIVLHPLGTTLERSGADARWHTGAGPVLLPRRPSRRYPRFDPRFPPRPGETLDGGDLRLLADVAQAGFHVVGTAGEEGRWHAYSVGLFRSWDHPEVAVFGLAPEILQTAVARLGERVRKGERFEHGDVDDAVLDDRAVAFRRIVPRHCAGFLARAVWYHAGVRFPALQAVWADPDGRFPWDRWFPRELRDAQPVLFEPEPA